MSGKPRKAELGVVAAYRRRERGRRYILIVKPFFVGRVGSLRKLVLAVVRLKQCKIEHIIASSVSYPPLSPRYF